MDASFLVVCCDVSLSAMIAGAAVVDACEGRLPNALAVACLCVGLARAVASAVAARSVEPFASSVVIAVALSAALVFLELFWRRRTGRRPHRHAWHRGAR